jgi:hypothetical protein
MQGPGLGRVEDVLLVAGGQGRETGIDLAQARLAVLGQVDAAEVEVAQGVLDQLAAIGRLVRKTRTARQAVERRVESGVLGHLTGVLGELGQTGVVGSPQCLGIHHRVQVAHRRPDVVQPRIEPFQRHDEIIPLRCLWKAGQELGGRLAVRGEDGIHGRLDVLRANAAEGGQGFGG